MKKISILLVMLLTLQTMVFPVFGSNSGSSTGNLTGSNKPSVTARSAILMDANSGEILYEKNINTKRYPASITKIMTTLVAIENCNSLYDTITYSKHAIDSIEPSSSQIYIEPGEKLSVEDSLYAIMLESANEACNGVAEHVAGSIEGFADMMNQKAKELGCKNTHFVNPNGLHDDNHYVTAYDMALITKAALANETFRKIASTVSYTIPVTNKCKSQRPLWMHHKMVKRTAYVYDGVEGGKTGFTMKARNTLVTWCKRDGLELIAIVLRDDGVEEYTDTIKLFNYGYKNFKSYNPLSTNTYDGFSSDSDDTMIQSASRLTPYQVTIDGNTSYSVITNKNTNMEDLDITYSYNKKKKCNSLDVLYNKKNIGSVPFTLTITN
ncbi:MAG: D-alanyl-D-alanine carboxypeptidase family protein [Lachnospiraceae bacterium]|nr:D-alanyl-D-alanine carboxypeptidase family protein [Lachnospiraceae bacterium]